MSINFPHSLLPERHQSDKLMIIFQSLRTIHHHDIVLQPMHRPCKVSNVLFVLDKFFELHHVFRIISQCFKDGRRG